MLSWCFNSKNDSSYNYRALGLVDSDSAGIGAIEYFNKMKSTNCKGRVKNNLNNKVNIKSLPVPDFLKEIKEKLKHNLAITIESHFLDKVLKNKDKCNWFRKLDEKELCELTNGLLNYTESAKDYINNKIDQNKLNFIKYLIKDEYKIELAKYICKEYGSLESLGFLNKVIKF